MKMDSKYSTTMASPNGNISIKIFNKVLMKQISGYLYMRRRSLRYAECGPCKTSQNKISFMNQSGSS